MKPRALLFDLDGTLQDTYSIHYQAFRAAFAHFGRDLNEQDYQSAYSPNWLLTYQTLNLPPEDWEEADKVWIAEASKLRPEPFPGVIETLRSLSESFNLGLVTSGSKERVLRELGENGLGAFFPVVVTGGDVPNPKPAPDGILMALTRLGVQPQDCAYIGDTALDYETARNAGVSFIGIPSRFAALPPGTPGVRLARFTDLLDWLPKIG